MNTSDIFCRYCSRYLKKCNWQRHIQSQIHKKNFKREATHIRIQGSTIQRLSFYQSSPSKALENAIKQRLQSDYSSSEVYIGLNLLTSEEIQVKHRMTDSPSTCVNADNIQPIKLETPDCTPIDETESMSSQEVIDKVDSNMPCYSVTVNVLPGGTIKLKETWMKL